MIENISKGKASFYCRGSVIEIKFQLIEFCHSQFLNICNVVPTNEIEV
jgi:hypothetical protein